MLHQRDWIPHGFSDRESELGGSRRCCQPLAGGKPATTIPRRPVSRVRFISGPAKLGLSSPGFAGRLGLHGMVDGGRKSRPPGRFPNGRRFQGNRTGCLLELYRHGISRFLGSSRCRFEPVCLRVALTRLGFDHSVATSVAARCPGTRLLPQRSAAIFRGRTKRFRA